MQFVIALLAMALLASGWTDAQPQLLFSGDSQPKPSLGINAGPLDSDMRQWVFTNIFKHAAEWWPTSSWDNWRTWSYEAPFNTTWSSDGYPLAFNATVNGKRYGYRTTIGTAGNYPTGAYMITWRGTGNITLLGDARNVSVTSRYPDAALNRLDFVVNATTTAGIMVVIVAPNVTCVDMRERLDETNGLTFGRNFSAAVQLFRVVRFSQWMVARSGQTVANANVEWSTRRPKTYYTQVGQTMVSIEYMVELANVFGKEMWLSVPSSANVSLIAGMAQYVRDNLSPRRVCYVEQSSDKGFNNNNRNLSMQIVSIWQSVFGVDDAKLRVRFVLATWLPAYVENVMSAYSADDVAKFDVFSVAGLIGNNIAFNSDSYDVTQAANMTIANVTDLIRQQIYNDEIELIYLMNKVALLMPNKTLVGYNVGFRVHAPGFANRWKKTNASALEQQLEDLIIAALRQPVVEDLYLDFMKRWYKLGAGLMVLNNLVDYTDRCLSGGGRCGYQSILESLSQVSQMTVPKYRAALQWVNHNYGRLPFTLADVAVPAAKACAKCVWGVCYNGACQCYTGYAGASCEQRVAKFLDCASKKTLFGVNVDGLADWSTEVTFVDLQRRARQWIVQKMVYATSWAQYNQSDVQLRDQDGYPQYLEVGKAVGTFLTRDLQAHFINGDYVYLYDGDGTLDLSFADQVVTSRGPGRIELTVNHKTEFNNGIYYTIIRTNPSNPVRNVRMMEARYESLYQQFPFHPLFLELMRKYEVVRFMPWSNLNVDNTLYDWSNRTTDSYYTFRLRTGVSLEKQVQLCNFLGNNPWFNLPHLATDAYITNWAQYVRDMLRPDVTAYIEIGNECWSGANPCGSYAQMMGTVAHMNLTRSQNLYSADTINRICYHAMTAASYFDIIKQVFGAENRTRIKLVINMQAAWLGPLQVFFLCNGSYYKSFDVVAIAPYMSSSMKRGDGSLVSIDEFFNSTVYAGISASLAQLNATAQQIAQSPAPGIQLATYEAGPDYSSLTETSNTALTNLSINVHRDPRMYAALTYYIGNLTSLNLSVYNHFLSTGSYTKYGCWGLLEWSVQNVATSPKYQAYQDIINAKRVCDWREKPSACPNNCSSMGVCTATSPLAPAKDTCYCSFGSNGTSCENNNLIVSSQCTYQCGGKGTCAFDHVEQGVYAIYTCHCYPGYYGYGCQLFNCTSECNYNGACVDSQTCACYRGFKGKYCDVDCGCMRHGVCSNSTNECICDAGYVLRNGTCSLDCAQAINVDNSACLTCPGDCGMGTCLSGVCECWAGYALDPATGTTCSLAVAAPNDGSRIGINVNGVVDWSTQWTFVDLIKQARDWIVQYADNLNTLYIWSLAENVTRTADNYPARVEPLRQTVTLMLRDVAQHWPNTTYTVFYDGEGVLDFGFDARVIDATEKNKMTINVSLTTQLNNGVFMKIRKTNAANPLRNIRIVMSGYENLYERIPFHPLFVQRLAAFKTIRFMPWTAEKGVVDWSDRVTPTGYAAGRGVAYEHMIQLCNVLKANAWLTVPYGASDAFVAELATLVKATLRKDVKVYVEYTNEAWNSLFDSGNYCRAMGSAANLSSDPFVACNFFYARRSRQIITIWRQVYGADAADKQVVLVLATFVLMPVVSARILAFENASRAHSNVLLAVTGYFDCGSPSASVVVTSDLSTLFAMCDADMIKVNATLQQQSLVASNYSVSMAMYESGSSVMEYAAIAYGSETPGATAKYIAMNEDLRMYDVYKKYYRMFNRLNLTENCHYGYVALPSKYGSWDLLEYQDQNVSFAHRYRAIMELIDETRIN